MPITDAVNDNAPLLDLDEAGAGSLGDTRLEAVAGAALLVATAFRLRDEDALILTLRRLTDAVDALETDTVDEDERRAACG